MAATSSSEDKLFTVQGLNNFLRIERHFEIILPLLKTIVGQIQLSLLAKHGLGSQQCLNARLSDFAKESLKLYQVLLRIPDLRMFVTTPVHYDKDEYMTKDDLRLLVETIVRKPRKYMCSYRLYDVDFTFQCYLFVLSQLIWSATPDERATVDHESVLEPLWTMYAKKRTISQSESLVQPEKVDSKLFAYVLSMVFQLMSYWGTTSFEGAAERIDELQTLFLSNLSDTRRTSVGLLSYNVLLNPLRSKTFERGFDILKCIKDLTQAILAICDLYPDLGILAFQEANDLPGLETRDHLMKSLGSHSHFRKWSSLCAESRAMVSSGTLTGTKYQIVDQHHIPIVFPDFLSLPATGEPILLKDMLNHGAKDIVTNNFIVITNLKVGAHSLIVINQHINSGDDYNNRNKRKYQLGKLLEYIRTLPELANVVIAGDFNQDPNETLAMLIELKYPEAYIASLRYVSTLMKFQTFVGKRLDYCIYNSHTMALIRSETCPSSDFQSDHFPVYMQFEFLTTIS